jgi:hypothetical protein
MLNRSEKLRKLLNQLEIEYHIAYSGQEILKECAMGLDGKNRKLLVVQKQNLSYYEWNLIDLDEVLNCTLKTTYKSIMAGELKKKTIEECLETIKLRFEFWDNRAPVEITFYDHKDHKGVKVSELNRKARNWQILLSKMLKNRLQQIV